MTAAEYLRERVRGLVIQSVVAPHQGRAVEDRNREARPPVLDAVLLDDVWKIIDDLAEQLAADTINPTQEVH